MGQKKPTRRLFLQSAGVMSTIVIAGCSGSGDDTEDTPEETEATDTPEGTDTTDTPEGTDATDTPEDISIFADYGIDGTDLSVELTEDALQQVAEIRVETPSGEQTTEVSETITGYSINILRDRAGTWFIDGLDDNGNAIETVELETTFDASVDDIGTFAQLGVTASTTLIEETNFQLTVTNSGGVPIEPAEIEITVPNADSYTDTIGGDEIQEYSEDPLYDGGVVDRDGNTIIESGDNNTYAFMPSESPLDLLVGEQEDLNELAGQSFEGEFVISYQAEREDTVVPITVNIGDEVVTDTDISSAYISGTVIEER
jgi:hypothetical protein